MVTTIRGVPALDDTDPLALVGQYSRDLQTYLYGKGVKTNLTLLAGFAGATPSVQRIGNGVEVVSNGNITGTFPEGLTEVLAPGAIPVEMRPPSNRWGCAFFSSSTIGVAVVRADGSVAVVQQTGGARSTMQFSLNWFV